MSRPATRSLVSTDLDLQKEQLRHLQNAPGEQRRRKRWSRATQTTWTISPKTELADVISDDNVIVNIDVEELVDENSDQSGTDTTTIDQSANTIGDPSGGAGETPSDISDSETSSTASHTPGEEQPTLEQQLEVSTASGRQEEASTDRPEVPGSQPEVQPEPTRMSDQKLEELFGKLTTSLQNNDSAKPTRFGGTQSEDAEAWLDHFCNYGDLRGWSDDVRVKQLALYMHNIAAIWFKNVSDDDKKDWAKVKSSFTSNFVDNKDYILEKVENTRMSTFKTPEQYVNNMILMCNKAGLKGKDMIPHLERGLPSDIKHLVKRARPKTLNDCLDEIYFHTSISEGAEATVKSATTDKQICTIAEAITKLAARLEKLESTPANTDTRSHGGSRGGYRGGRKGHITCFTCNKPGHYSDECWHNKNGNNYGGNRGRGRRNYGNRGGRSDHKNSDSGANSNTKNE